MFSQDFYVAVEEEKRKLVERLAALDTILGDRATTNHAPQKPGRHLSAEARQKIADAQKLRWAKVRKQAKK